MRWLPAAIPLLIAIIALDFAIVFGFEAWRILLSPTAGFDQLAFANLVFGIGRIAGLSPEGVMRLAVFFGALNLTTAVLFALYLVSRVRALRGFPIAHHLLDVGLILAVVSTIVMATPAVLNGATEFLVQQRLPLWLVGLAATLSLIERLAEPRTRPPGFWERMLIRKFARMTRETRLMVQPAQRGRTQPVRWDALRREAGMTEPKMPLHGEGQWYAPHAR
jgi:hypothetical protein